MGDIKNKGEITGVVADSVIASALNINTEAYCFLTFIKHEMVVSSLPNVPGQSPEVEVEQLAQSRITIPIAVAIQLANTILNELVPMMPTSEEKK